MPTPSEPPARVDPRYADDEATMLRAYLDYHRATFRWKTGGLTQAQLGQPLPSSSLTLAGLVKHAALNEYWWFGVTLVGSEMAPPFTDVDFDADPQWEFRTALDDSPEALHELFDRAVAASDAAITSVGDLDAEGVRRDKTGERATLRWILLHMIEEYARHNGHVDLIREAIDGLTGE